MTSKIDFNKTALRQCFLYDCLSGITAAESSRRICAAFGQHVVAERTAQRWFDRFRSGNYSLEDEPKSGRPSKIDDKQLRQIVEADPRQTTRDLATALGCVHSTIVKHLAAIGKKSKLGQWVPHDLTDHDRQRRVEVCTWLLSYKRTHNWLDSIVTGDEKWVLYVNYRRKR
jgi:[histone H3]-lysine36 N-dimethyltransferase SETMAR